MPAEIIRINEKSWRIEDGGVRFFLLEGTEKALLIDTGMTTVNAREIAESLTDLPLTLVNTHSDRDHIAGNGAFENVYMHPAEEAHYRESGGTGRVLPVREGDVFDLGGRTLEVIELEGHTLGSIALLDTGSRVLISGDSIQRNGRVFMFGAHRDMRKYYDSMRRLEKRMSEFDEVWPSHADIPISPELIPQLAEGAGKILRGELAGTPVEFRGNTISSVDLGFTTILCGA